jgi:hypothetical protein
VTTPDVNTQISHLHGYILASKRKFSAANQALEVMERGKLSLMEPQTSMGAAAQAGSYRRISEPLSTMHFSLITLQ